MRIIDDAGAKQALLDGAPYDVTVTVTPAGGTAVVIDGDNIAQNGISINPSSVSGNKLELGSVISATADFDFFNYDGTLDGVDFRGAELYVEGSVDVSGTATTFPIGYFIADTVKITGRKIHVAAFDRMILLDKIATQLPNWPAIPYHIIWQSVALCGIPFVQIDEEDYPGWNYFVREWPTGQVTYRQLVSWALQIMGCCLKINNKGEAEIVNYASAEWSVTPDTRFEGAVIQDNPVTFTGVAVWQNGSAAYVAGSAGYTFDISENPFLIENVETITDEIWAFVGAVSYYPATFDIIHNVLAEPFDIVDYTDDDGTVKSVAVTDVVWDFSARTKIQSKGASEETESYAPQLAFTPQQVGQLADASRLKIGRIESLDESVYFDLNSGEISTNNTTERVTGANSKSVYETTLDFSEGTLALVLKKDGTEIGRTEIGRNGLNIEMDETQGFSVEKPDNWDNWAAGIKLAWWLEHRIAQTLLNMYNTVNNSITVTNKDKSTYFQQSNLSSQLLQIIKAVAGFTSGERIELSFDGLEVQHLSFGEGDIEPAVTQSEYKYDHASVQGTVAAATGIKVGSADYNDPAAKEVATQEYVQNYLASLLGDYVEESGTEGVWEWKKWHSGAIDCWGVSQLSVPANGWGGSGSMYYVNGSEAYPANLFPATPELWVHPGNDDLGGNLFLWAAKHEPSTASTAKYRLCRSSNFAQAVTIDVNLYAHYSP